MLIVEESRFRDPSYLGKYHTGVKTIEQSGVLSALIEAGVELPSAYIYLPNQCPSPEEPIPAAGLIWDKVFAPEEPSLIPVNGHVAVEKIAQSAWFELRVEADPFTDELFIEYLLGQETKRLSRAGEVRVDQSKTPLLWPSIVPNTEPIGAFIDRVMDNALFFQHYHPESRHREIARRRDPLYLAVV